VRTREALTASRVEWTNRRGSGQGSTAADAAMAGVITRLEAEIVALDQAIEDAIGQDKDLQTRHDLLISVPGIGTHTAAVILSELPSPEVLRTAREAAAYAGLNPSHRQSGSSLDAPSRISRIGNATLRAALYFPALAALRWNPLVAALRQRLKDQGRLKPKQIVGAAMRKLLHLCFGVLKTGKPFDPDHATSTDEIAATT
jgi:transposase